MPPLAPGRQVVFLSYAWEDVALMRWMAGKLALAGYAVWCDQWRLFGGLDWPTEIDVAIKTRTARMVALVSTHSLQKPNPQREWTLALTLERERRSDAKFGAGVSVLKPAGTPKDTGVDGLG